MAAVLPIYMYHQVAPKDAPGYEPHLYVTPPTFAKQVKQLKNSGLRLATLSQAWAAVAGGGGKGLAVLTFDDLSFNFVQYAMPVLLEERVPATAFQIAGMLTRQLGFPGLSNLNGCLAPLGPAELRGLTASGIEIGSHGMTHRELHRLDDRQLDAELVCSRQAIEQAAGVPCPTLCYPRGKFSPRVCAAARAAGYAAACTTLRGNVQEEACNLIIPRIRAAENRLGFRLSYTTSFFYDFWNRSRRESALKCLAEEDAAAQPGAELVPYREQPPEPRR